MKKIFYLTIILFTGLLAACKKDKNSSNLSPNSPGTTLDKIKDSVYLYAKEDYLWNSSLPSYASFNPRSFTNSVDLTALSSELNALSQYAINPSTGKPYEYYANNPGVAKYSFIDDGTETAALNGIKGDYGFDYNYRAVNDIRVLYVYPGSPAALAGIKRGYKITSVNSNTNITYDGAGYGTGSGTNDAFVYNAIFGSSTLQMTLKKPDSTTYTVNLVTASYAVNPILKDTSYTIGAHKVGYMVFNSFTSDANADGGLNAAISGFASQGITDLVVDLRYNGGGYVSTAEYLDNLIAPASTNGSLMYNTYYSSNMVNGTDPLLKNQVRQNSSGTDYNYSQINWSVAFNVTNFSKIGGLAITRVFFIITGNTASASELTINNLRPHMDVEFVGETSYGKPVGFIDIDINKYTMFTPEFYVLNSANQGNYYGGFTPGTTDCPGIQDLDDYTKDFGDPSEGLLADVFTYLQTGKYTASSLKVNNLSIPGAKTFSLNERRTITMNLNSRKFTGMIGKSLKPKGKS